MYLITTVFFLLPVCDEFFEYDVRNPSKEEERKMEHDMRFKLPLYICVFSDWFFTLYAIKLLVYGNYSFFNQVAILFGAGVLAGSNINVAHELTHKVTNILDFVIGWLTMSKCMYMHWVIKIKIMINNFLFLIKIHEKLLNC